MDGWMNNYSFT